MPTHDVSEAFDPSFLDNFTIIRRVQHVNQYGRVEIVEGRWTGVGVVVASSPNDLQRLPEMQYFNKAVTIYTQWKLQGPAPNMQPDEIIWHGSQYLVRSLEDYSGYGRGFISCVCLSIDSVDPAPYLPDNIGVPMGSAD
jgi:hypothetical protein